jgi:hypothetical protein
MVDQNELIEQYRTTLEVMHEKLLNLREDKEKRLQEIHQKKTSSPEYQKLEQNLEILQESIQTLNLEIFKEKGTLRKLKAESEWGEDSLQNSEQVQFLINELEVLQAENQELKSEKPPATGESKLAQLEHSNPKLYSLVKKIIAVEETNTLLKEELIFLEQERNKIRAEYHKITQYLGHEEKIKLKIRESEKEAERSAANKKFLEIRIKDLIFDLERAKEMVRRSDTKQLMIRFEHLVQKKEESARLVSELVETVEKIESEIEMEKVTGNKEQPTNLKLEVKNLENEITEKTKELKVKIVEKKKLQEELDKKMKEKNNYKKLIGSKTRDNSIKGNVKHLISKSTTNLKSFDSTRREAIVGIIGKNVIDNNPRELKKVLKNVGSQDMGIATKLVQLNREEFLKNLKLN